MDVKIPPAVLADALGEPAVALTYSTEPIAGSTGAATNAVDRLTGRARCHRAERPFVLIRKKFRPLTAGRHAAGAADPQHWAYWRREPLAYAPGALPTGPGLAAPRCHGMVDDVVYLQDVTGPAEQPRIAASRLAAWQSTASIPDVPWLAGHQLAQRLAVSDLDWGAVDADPRLASIWSQRFDLLAALTSKPMVLSHGDFHIGNLVAVDDGTIALDWGTLGMAPAGADLAHLALSTLEDLVDDYLTGWTGIGDTADIRLAYRITLALTGASRIHWMLSRQVPVPDRYEDFVVSQAWWY